MKAFGAFRPYRASPQAVDTFVSLLRGWYLPLLVLQEDRYAQIERDNRLLLEKMSHIMRKGGVDNHNSTSKYAKSLNKEARKKELHKITMENQVCACACPVSVSLCAG